jgi:hypothetical protein
LKQIQEYWSDVLKDIREFEEIAKAINPEIEVIWQAVRNLMDDQFIQTATERGIARREKMLGITQFADDTLESRRFRVLARWNDKLPYTYRVLQSKLDQLCGVDGYEMILDAGSYSLKIKVELVVKRMFEEVEKIAKKMLPANILLSVELRYNQYFKLSEFTHGQLSNYTHNQIRNEVIS